MEARLGKPSLVRDTSRMTLFTAMRHPVKVGGHLMILRSCAENSQLCIFEMIFRQVNCGLFYIHKNVDCGEENNNKKITTTEDCHLKFIRLIRQNSLLLVQNFQMAINLEHKCHQYCEGDIHSVVVFL